MSTPADAWLQGRGARSPSAVHALLDTPCRCHAADRRAQPEQLAPAVVDPQLTMRTFRPLVQHVRSRMRGAKDRFAQWDRLHDDDRVSAQVADAWLLEASRWLRDPVLGLNALAGLKRGMGDVVELAAESAPNLGAALTAVARFARLIYEGADFHLYTSDQLACLELRYTLPVSHVSSDYIAALVLHGIRRWLGLGSGIQLWFKDQDARNPSVYAAALAPVSVQFGTRVDAIVLPRGLLDLPLAGSDPVLHDILMRFAESQTCRRREEDALSEQVRHLLTAVLTSEGNGHVGSVARKLGMSQRSLARQLQREGHTFSALLDEVRKQRALHLVEHSRLPSYRIARILGYRSTATFCRAFARWQGTSPLHHRSALLKN